MLHQLLQTNHKLHREMFLQVRMSNKFRIYAYFKIILALFKLFCIGPHYFRRVQIILDGSKLVDLMQFYKFKHRNSWFTYLLNSNWIYRTYWNWNGTELGDVFETRVCYHFVYLGQVQVPKLKNCNLFIMH